MRLVVERTAPNLELAYNRLTPVFFVALSRLAKQGFVVSPSDGLDLIHDFFAEAWSGLESHFRPEKGSFDGYAYGAFVHFARPRIVKLSRWRQSLTSEEVLDALPGQPLEAASSLDQQTIRRAIRELPDLEQHLFRRFVYSDFASERALAKEFEISRYRLHEILVEALGRVAVALDRPTGISSADWEVALALWRDCRTIREAASVLGLTTHQVRRANLRNIEFIAEALQQYQPRTRHMEGNQVMATPEAVLSASALFALALKSPDNQKLIGSVRARAAQILEELETYGCPISEREIEEISPAWIAAVYAAVVPEAEKGIDARVDEDLFSTHRNEDHAIGIAFRETLLADLPAALREPIELGSLPKISEKDFEILNRAPDVEAAGSVGVAWIRHGIRPVTVFYATEAVSGLLDRLLRKKFLAESSLVLGSEAIFIVDDKQKRFELRALMLQEISQMSDCGPEAAALLYAWMLQVAQYKAWLFAGFVAQPKGSSIVLNRDSERVGNVYQHWGLMARTMELTVESC